MPETNTSTCLFLMEETCMPEHARSAKQGGLGIAAHGRLLNLNTTLVSYWLSA